MRLLPKFKYPKPRRSNCSETLHGYEIADPYRWMEDPDAAETKEFVDAENAFSKSYLDCTQNEDMRTKLDEVLTHEQMTIPRKFGDFYYYGYNSGLEEHNVIYRRKNLQGAGEVFLDPNLFSEDGSVTLSAGYPSKSGKYYAYAVSESGSDWMTIRIRRADDKSDLNERLEGFRYANLAWTHDESGFFYGRYPLEKSGDANGRNPKAAENQKIYYHKVGTSQDEDVLVVEFHEHPKWRMSVAVSHCGKRLIVNVSDGLKGVNVYIADIPDKITGLLSLSTIQDNFVSQLSYVTSDGDDFYFHTNRDRPNFALVKVNLAVDDNAKKLTNTSRWVDVIPEDPKRAMSSVHSCCSDKFVVRYSDDVVSVVEVYDMKSGKMLQRLPFDFGSIWTTEVGRKSCEFFFSFQSPLTPGVIYRTDLSAVPSAKMEEYYRTKLPALSTEGLSFERTFYESSNSTRVPMFIMRRNNQTLDGTAPGYLYVYGGFGLSIAPTFSMFRLMLVYALGFVVSVANVRGGGEYGEMWHNAGRLENKQNTLDDVHAAARYLVNMNYTSSDRLTLAGKSNGGMVTLASINQRPELFGAAIADVPITDLFRFHKFTVGHAWISDYGNPDNASDFEFIRRVSPLHNIPKGIDNYPALLIVTADHDDRVVPSHSLKFTAELRYRLGETNRHPLLTLVNTEAGHATVRSIEGAVEEMCFMTKSLGVDTPQVATAAGA